MKILKIFNIFLISFLLLANPFFAGESKGNNASEYQISTNDLLEIKVYEEHDLTKIVRVGPDGTISFPLLGSIEAAGLTIRQLENTIRDLLAKDYLVNPQVSVLVQDYSNISVLGQVKSPGSYDMKGSISLTQAIAAAGGFTESADTSDVRIIRNNKNKSETIEVNAEKILKRLTPDIDLKPNDTLIVEELGQVFVMGQVVKPGSYQLKEGLTVIEAIALSGGLTETAAANGTKVIRVKEGKKKVFYIPVGSILQGGDKSRDITLESGDTVVVPESFF